MKCDSDMAGPGFNLTFWPDEVIQNTCQKPRYLWDLYPKITQWESTHLSDPSLKQLVILKAQILSKSITILSRQLLTTSRLFVFISPSFSQYFHRYLNLCLPYYIFLMFIYFWQGWVFMVAQLFCSCREPGCSLVVGHCPRGAGHGLQELWFPGSRAQAQ